MRDMRGELGITATLNPGAISHITDTITAMRGNRNIAMAIDPGTAAQIATKLLHRTPRA
jgi:hypothetical protein